MGFAGIFSAANVFPRTPETGRMEKKKSLASGNEAVFRGSFQLSRLIFPEGESGWVQRLNLEC
jgi:hypothetical protein